MSLRLTAQKQKITQNASKTQKFFSARLLLLSFFLSSQGPMQGIPKSEESLYKNKINKLVQVWQFRLAVYKFMNVEEI